MRKILIVNPFGIGDMLFSFPLMERLKRQTGETVQIGFMGNERTEALCRMCGLIDEVFVFNRDYFRQLWSKDKIQFLKEMVAFLRTIRERKYDALIDLSLGREFSFYARLIGIHQRIGFDYKGRGFFLNRKIKMDGYINQSVADTQKELLRFLEINHHVKTTGEWFRDLPALDIKGTEWLLSHGVGHNRQCIAVAPGGGKSWGSNAVYKQWGPDRFAEIIRRLNQEGPRHFIILGDLEDKELADQMMGHLKGVSFVRVIGEPLELVSALLRNSEILLCNDGGLGHLANALHVKTVVIFGPVDEKIYGPTCLSAGLRVVYEPVSCRPCYQKFNFPGCVYGRRCLEDLKVDKVLEAVYSMLNHL